MSRVKKSFEKFFRNESSHDRGKDLVIEVDNPSFELETLLVNHQELKEKTIDFKILNESIQKLRDEEFLKIENCPSMASAFETFIALIPSFFMRISSALGVIMNIDGFTEYFSDQQFHQVHNALKNFNRSFLLANQTTDGSGCIYWRLEGVEQIFYCIIGNNKANCVEFVAKYLMRQLKNGRTGLLPNYQPSEYLLNIRIDLCNLIDIRGYDLLLLAAECGNIEVVKVFLSQSSFDVNFTGLNGKNAADLAYEGKHFDLLLELLKNNSKFPQNFIETEFPDELNNFIKTTKNFHLAIRENDEEKIEKIHDENLSLKHYYSTQNVSAVATSILSQSFEIYKFLISEQIYLGPHENFNDIRSQLSEEDCRLLRECHNEKSQNFMEDHIMTLMGNSSVGLDEPDNQSKLSYALDAFKVVDKIPIISLILQIVAALKNFKITFDFQRNDVGFLDPSSEQDTNGLFYTTGRIYIAAANLLNAEKFNEVCGTIAHELCHFVMFKVFNNLAKPYAENEIQKIEDYEDVWRQCERLQSQEKIIEKVFTGYDFDVQHAELIVRVPHILAHYHDDPQKLEELQNVFAPLFDFFNIRCMPEMEAALPRFIEEGKKTKTELKQKKQIKILLWSLLALFMIGSVAVFTTNLTTFLLNQPDPVYDGKNLTQKLKEEFMESNVNFQGEPFKLKDFLEPDSKAFYELTMEQVQTLIDGNPLNISKPTENVNFYVERKFIDEDKKVLNRDELYDRYKEFILSDFPGAGKTTTFKNLAIDLKKKNPSRWLSYIDLKQYTKPFRKFKNTILTAENVVKFLAREILDLSNFEAEIFEISYQQDKVTFLWDGIDEVSPDYGGFVINLIDFIRKNSRNQNLVSTRSFLQKGIKASLKIEIFRLHPFSLSDRETFIKKYMEYKNINSTIEHAMKIIQPFFDKLFNETCDEDNPLMLGMICDLHFNKDQKKLSLSSANTFSVYENYIVSKLEILNEKGPIVARDRVKSELNRLSILEVHQYYAIAFLFSNDSYFLTLNIMQHEPDFNTTQENLRFGLLVIENDRVGFIHRTFAEYFLAQFIINNVIEIKYEPSVHELGIRLQFVHKMMNDIYQRFTVVKNFIEEYLKNDKDENVGKASPKVVETIKEIRFDLLEDITHHRYNTNTVLKYLQFHATFFRRNYEILRVYWKIDEDENIFTFIFKELELWKVENEKWFKRVANFVEKNFNQKDLIKLIPWTLNQAPYDTSISSLFRYYIWSSKTDKNEIADFFKPKDIEEVLKIENHFDFLIYLNSSQPTEAVKKVLLCELPEITKKSTAEIYPKVLDFAENILSHDEMERALLKIKFASGSAIILNIYLSPQNLHLLLDLYQKYLKDEIPVVLFAKNSWGYSALLNALYSRQNQNVEILWDFIDRNLKRKEIVELLEIETTYSKNIPLFYATKSPENLEKFTKIYRKYFGIEKLTEIILNRRNRDSLNFLQFYLTNGTDKIDIIDFLNNTIKLRPEQFRTILLHRNNFGQNSFLHAKKMNKSEIMEPLKIYLTPEDLKELLIEQPQIKIREDALPSCKYKVELPKELEKFQGILEKIGVNQILDNWIQNDPEILDLFIKTLDIAKIGKLISQLKPEHLSKAKEVINVLGIENLKRLSPSDAAKLLSVLGDLELDQILTNLNSESVKNLGALIEGFGGIENLIPVLTPRDLNGILRGTLDLNSFLSSLKL